MKKLKIYKSLPEWDAATLPKSFQRKHNTAEGTWAQLTVRSGKLKFTYLDVDGQALSSVILDASASPPLIEPGVWHKVEPLDDALRCQLSFLCESSRYLQKKYGLTAPDAEVCALVPELARTQGGSVVDLGSGRGRNSFFLAEQGFSVTAVDRSDAAIETLRTIQKSEKIELSSSVYDINQASLANILKEDQVDHILGTTVFKWLEAKRVPRVINDMQVHTRKGGLHLIVAPVTSDERPCPKVYPFAFERGGLCRYYQKWEILRYEEQLGELQDPNARGDVHKVELVTLLARKRE